MGYSLYTREPFLRYVGDAVAADDLTAEAFMRKNPAQISCGVCRLFFYFVFVRK